MTEYIEKYKEKYLKYKLKYIQLKKQIGGTSDLKCIYCSSDWIYKLNPAMCEGCYTKQHKSVLEYHKLQDKTKDLIYQNKITEGIEKLEEVIRLRNKHADKWFDGGNKGHNYFANEFLRNLIDRIKNNPYDAKKIWEYEFSKLAEPMD